MAFSKQGWAFIVQWEGNGTWVKAGFTTVSLPKMLMAFAKHSPHRLVVVKAWETTKDDYALVAERLQPFVSSHGQTNGWMKVTDGLRRIVREDLPCNSLKAKSQFKRVCGDAVLWLPWLFPSEEFIPMPIASVRKQTRAGRGKQSILRSSGF